MLHILVDVRFPACQDDVYCALLDAVRRIATSLGDCTIFTLRGTTFEAVPAANLAAMRVPGVPLHPASPGNVNIFLQSLQAAIRLVPREGRVVLVTFFDVTAALNTVMVSTGVSFHVGWCHISSVSQRAANPSPAFQYSPCEIATMEQTLHELVLRQLVALRGGSQKITLTLHGSVGFQCEALAATATDKPFPVAWTAHSIVPLDSIDEAWIYGPAHFLLPADGTKTAMNYFDALDNANLLCALVTRLRGAGAAVLISALLPSVRLWGLAFPPEDAESSPFAEHLIGPILLVRYVAGQQLIRHVPHCSASRECTPYAQQKVDAALQGLPHVALDVMSLCCEGAAPIVPSLTSTSTSAQPTSGIHLGLSLPRGESAAYAMGSIVGARNNALQRKPQKPRTTKFN